jgi:hypothetical protein
VSSCKCLATRNAQPTHIPLRRGGKRDQPPIGTRPVHNVTQERPSQALAARPRRDANKREVVRVVAERLALELVDYLVELV